MILAMRTIQSCISTVTLKIIVRDFRGVEIIIVTVKMILTVLLDTNYVNEQQRKKLLREQQELL